MRRKACMILGGIFLCGFLMALSAADTAQTKDPVIASNYTLIPGSGACADTLAGAHNVFLDYAAKNDDNTVNAVIEIPEGTNAQWTTDVETGRLVWPLMNNARSIVHYLGYPCNYGMVPRTRCGNGAPFDILVFGGPLLRGAVTSVKIIGVMNVKESGTINHKLMSVIPGSPMDGIHSLLEFNAQYPGLMSIVQTWFTNYKGADSSYSIVGFGEADTADALLDAAVIDTDTAVVQADYAESANDSLIVAGYTRIKGDYGVVNGVLGSCDTVTYGKDLYHDTPVANNDGTHNAIIEIPAGATAKWQTSNENGKFYWENKAGNPRINKFLGYPGSYGEMPQTMSGDGDPLDVVVIGDFLLRGEIPRIKIIGVLCLADQGLNDDKLIAVVPGGIMGTVNSLAELNADFPGVTSIFETFFLNYKGIGGGLASNGFGEVDTAMVILKRAIDQYFVPVKDRAVLGHARFALQCLGPVRSGAKALIRISLASSQRVVLTVYDISGQKVATLADRRLEAGGHLFQWNTQGVRSGCYCVKLQAGAATKAGNLFLCN